MRTQGNIANSTGSVLEQTIISILRAKGFELVKFRVWDRNKDNYGEELLLENVPYESIYGHKGNTEFLLKSKKYNLKIRIECKWQQSAGSVDEKFPYLYLNCVESMPENHIIIIVDGGGYKEGALEWLKNSAKIGKYQGANCKNIEVMRLIEFITWANITF